MVINEKKKYRLKGKVDIVDKMIIQGKYEHKSGLNQCNDKNMNKSVDETSTEETKGKGEAIKILTD